MEINTVVLPDCRLHEACLDRRTALGHQHPHTWGSKTALWGFWDQITTAPLPPLSFRHCVSFFSGVAKALTGSFAGLLRSSNSVWHVPLGALGLSFSHAETWRQSFKAPCVLSLLTFSGAHTLLTLTWLLWIKYVSSVSRSFNNIMWLFNVWLTRSRGLHNN